MDTITELNYKTHKRYLKYFLTLLPKSFCKFDSTRVMIAFFSVSGLDILNSLDSISINEKHNIIEWIYSLQVLNEEELVSGFQGSTTFNTEENKNSVGPYKWNHIAYTYCALLILVILGDDLSRVHKKELIKSLKALQLPNGCYTAAKDGTESDMRFLFCAAAICYVLDDWNGMDIKNATEFIINSISYDNGIAQGPELESHGGSTFCALATLALSNQLHMLNNTQNEGLKRWLLWRQEDGFNGRPNKPVDSCYTFWVGGALKILNAYNFINTEILKSFVLATQSDSGGFSKWVSSDTDPLHTHMTLAGLSLMKYENLNEVLPMLNLTYKSHEFLENIHKTWRNSENHA